MPKTVIIIEDSFIAKLAAKRLGTATMAITLGNKIHLHNASKAEFLGTTSWLCHELKHVQQFNDHGFFIFICKYLLESFRKGYYNNRWEVEARDAEDDFSLLDAFVVV